MVLTELILGLDIGSTSICASFCDVDAKGEISLRGIGTSMTSGLDKTGKITDELALTNSISRAIKRAESEAGEKASKVLVNLPFHQLSFCENLGLFLSKEAQGQISENDRKEAVKRSKNIVKESTQTLAHAIPITYKVDGTVVQNPVGVFGRNIEVNSHIILAHSETIDTLLDLLKSLGLHVSGFVYDGLASAQIYLSEEERQKGAYCLDIGGSVSKLHVFENNILKKTTLIPIGGETFTSDISKCLKVSIPEAERLKILHGDILALNSEDVIDITEIDTGRKKIKASLLSQILEARAKELLDLIFKDIDLDKTAPLILGGGGGQLKHLNRLIEQEYDLMVRIGLPDELKSIVESSSYATSLGLVLYGLRTGAVSYDHLKKANTFKAGLQWLLSIFLKK